MSGNKPDRFPEADYDGVMRTCSDRPRTAPSPIPHTFPPASRYARRRAPGGRLENAFSAAFFNRHPSTVSLFQWRRGYVSSSIVPPQCKYLDASGPLANVRK
ncbi:hypothetical protein MTP99_006206 [Tenebrio molitor]|nr:hypothetical protein MTP99_006206 [Tenebrio molitor]